MFLMTRIIDARLGATPELLPLVARIHDAHKVVVLTGAGCSAPSGLVTYRGAGGLYQKDPALERLLHVSNLATHRAEILEHLDAIRRATNSSTPNAAHIALAQMQHRLRGAGGECLIATQNVDGLHQRAGAEVVELHGSVHRARCDTATCQKVDLDEAPELRDCPTCGGLLRPDVVLFGENLDEGDFSTFTRAVRNCDVLLTIGTSLSVHPVASVLKHLPYLSSCVVLLKERDYDAPLPRQATVVLGDAAEIVPALLEL